MKSFSLILLACSAFAQAQTVQPSPSPATPVTPGVKMIDPSKTEPVPSAPAVKITPENAKPEPLTPPDPKQPKVADPKAAKADEPTIIDADESQFDPKSGIHTFIGHVKVKSPQFNMTTDGKLDVKMKDTPNAAPAGAATGKADAKGTPPPPGSVAADSKGKASAGKSDAPKASPTTAKGATPAVAKADAPKATPAADDDESTTSQIDTAVATGKLSTVTQKSPDGKIKEGVAQIIIYESTHGTLTLKEWPQVQSGPNRIIATEKSTIMILDKDNHLDVKGRATTKLEPDKDPNKQPASSKPKAPVAVPIPPPSAPSASPTKAPTPSKAPAKGKAPSKS